MNLKLITEKEAKYLMGAPAVAGGFVMTDRDANLAIEEAVAKINRRRGDTNYIYLTFFWGDAGINLTADEKALIIAELERRATDTRTNRVFAAMAAAAKEWLPKIEAAQTLTAA